MSPLIDGMQRIHNLGNARLTISALTETERNLLLNALNEFPNERVPMESIKNNGIKEIYKERKYFKDDQEIYNDIQETYKKNEDGSISVNLAKVYKRSLKHLNDVNYDKNWEYEYSVNFEGGSIVDIDTRYCDLENLENYIPLLEKTLGVNLVQKNNKWYMITKRKLRTDKTPPEIEEQYKGIAREI